MARLEHSEVALEQLVRVVLVRAVSSADFPSLLDEANDIWDGHRERPEPFADKVYTL
jgi:hypothetical protein